MDCYQCQYPVSHYSFEATEFSVLFLTTACECTLSSKLIAFKSDYKIHFPYSNYTPPPHPPIKACNE